ncbi:DUF3500 domain-containing protein [Tundrisphaera sp. TA3]|uniref:DUF3500 domain-containing protein n=1 Tax=Tundrisphaera sp. TA3 TaxID=3435775 RepID=UPI003EB79F23
MRRLALWFAVSSSILAPGLARADETGSNMAEAARRFLGTLDDKQRAQASFPFDSPERTNWHWIPRPRNGVPIKELGPDERSVAFGLIATGLSTKGFLKATTIMSYEELLRVEEKGTGPVRDSELYYLSVFGTPEDRGEWGWRVEGHHLALNFTLRHGKVVSATPFMFGSNPAEVPSGPRKGLRNLAEIQDPAYALLQTLTPEQRKTALVAAVAPEVTVTPNPAQALLITPQGIISDDLKPEQVALLHKVIEAYYVNFPEPIRSDLQAQFRQGQSPLYFAWYGPADTMQNHAFHIQGPTLYIDFNDTQNGVNHIHTFYRSLLGDFGASTAAASASH